MSKPHQGCLRSFSIIIVVTAITLWGLISAFAQTAVRPCIGTTAGDQSNCRPIDNGFPLPVTGAVSGGGGTQVQVISTASTNSTSVKASAGTLYDITAINTNAATAYLKFYDKASAPTCASDTVLGTYPLVQNIPVVMPSWTGKAFSLGIGLCITGGIAANDNTNATTGIAVSLTYK